MPRFALLPTVSIPLLAGSSLAQIAVGSTSTFDPSLAPSGVAVADFDGAVGAADLAILLGSWGEPGAADLDGDGLTGASDLALLLGLWT